MVIYVPVPADATASGVDAVDGAVVDGAANVNLAGKRAKILSANAWQAANIDCSD